PVLASQPHAPRCSRLTRIWIALRMMSCALRFFKSATKPTPQASCSYRGSYSPCATGGCAVVMSLTSFERTRALSYSSVKEADVLVAEVARLRVAARAEVARLRVAAR